MKQVGVNIEGKIIVSGIAALYFQEGIPLAILFVRLNQKNIMPSWIHLYSELHQNGMNHERIIHLLHENIFEGYGKEFRDVVIERLEALFGKLN